MSLRSPQGEKIGDGAHTRLGPWVEELVSVCYKWAMSDSGRPWMTKYLNLGIIYCNRSPWARTAASGANQGTGSKEILEQWEEMGLKEATKIKLLRDNAIELFRLH